MDFGIGMAVKVLKSTSQEVTSDRSQASGSFFDASFTTKALGLQLKDSGHGYITVAEIGSEDPKILEQVNRNGRSMIHFPLLFLICVR